MQGSWLLVGAPSRLAFPLLGALYSYHLGGDAWSLTKLFLPEPNASDNWLGNALAIDGNHAVAGAFIESRSEEQSGTSYVLGGFDPFTDEGFALAGTGGTPQLSGADTGCAGSSVNLVLTGARPDSSATLYIGATRVDRPFRGGTLVPAPQIVRRGLHGCDRQARRIQRCDTGRCGPDFAAACADLDRRPGGAAGDGGLERDRRQRALTARTQAQSLRSAISVSRSASTSGECLSACTLS